MKNFITTKIHPDLKKGLKLDSTGGHFWAFEL